MRLYVAIRNVANPEVFGGELAYIQDGDQVIAYLRRHGVYSNRRRYSFPILLLLDWICPVAMIMIRLLTLQPKRADGEMVRATRLSGPCPD